MCCCALQIPEKTVQTVVHRMHRVKEIWKLLTDQFLVLETMTPQEFLGFRDFLTPASGFQSVQFRLVENRLGLTTEHRLQYQRAPYTDALLPEHKVLVAQAEEDPSVFQEVEAWLERMPFTHDESGFDFWPTYVAAVNRGYDDEVARLEVDPNLDDESRKASIEEVEKGRQATVGLLEESKHEVTRDSKIEPQTLQTLTSKPCNV